MWYYKKSRKNFLKELKKMEVILKSFHLATPLPQTF